jgi:hypothetical protein
MPITEPKMRQYMAVLSVDPKVLAEETEEPIAHIEAVEQDLVESELGWLRDSGIYRECVKPLPKGLPEIVCLCGSTKFKKEFLAEAKKEAIKGCIVLSVGWFSHADGDTLPEGMTEKLDELHKRKLDLCDRVTIINVGGYIGESTRSEIEYAQNLGKPITYRHGEPL